MSDIASLFQRLQSASLCGKFAEELNDTPLSEAPVALHPLGFLTARIASRNGATLRLHLWAPGQGSAQAGFAVHNHAFNFLSQVIRGAFLHEIYTAEPNSAGNDAAYGVSYITGGSQLTKIPQRLQLCRVARSKISQFDKYELSHEVLHRLKPVTADQFSATLVLTVPKGASAVTIGPFEGPNTLAFTRTETGQSAAQAYQSLLP
jgi:hypothetical protein